MAAVVQSHVAVSGEMAKREGRWTTSEASAVNEGMEAEAERSLSADAMAENEERRTGKGLKGGPAGDNPLELEGRLVQGWGLGWTFHAAYSPASVPAPVHSRTHSHPPHPPIGRLPSRKISSSHYSSHIPLSQSRGRV